VELTMEITLNALMVFLVVGAVVALEVKDLLSSVIAVGVVGLGLSIVFLLLGAPDIAITQVVVEVIVVTVLIRLASRVPEPGTKKPLRLAPVVVGLALVGLLLAFMVGALGELPPLGEPLMTISSWYLENGPRLTGASNVVMAVLLDLRAYDTLGEATVILASILGTLVVLRRPAREDGHG